MTEKEQELVFHKTVGCIVANKLSVEYNGYMSLIYKDAGMNYLSNKCAAAEKASSDFIKRAKFKIESMEEKANDIVEFNADLIFETVALDPEHQQRVLRLVRKLRQLPQYKS